MKDLLRLSTMFFIPLAVIFFFAMMAPSRTKETQLSKSVPVSNVNYEVQSLVKTYDLSECFASESFDTGVCCSY